MSQDFFLLKTNLKLEALKDESRTKETNLMTSQLDLSNLANQIFTSQHRHGKRRLNRKTAKKLAKTENTLIAGR